MFFQVGEQHFVANQDLPLQWSVEWLNGPNPGYGFVCHGNEVDPSLDDLRVAAIAFLGDVDPVTGFLRES